MKFLITAKYKAVEYNGNAVVFATGKPPFINIHDDLLHNELSPGKYTYKTGLRPHDIDSNTLLTTEEKVVFKERQAKLLEKIKEVYSDEILAADNALFWGHDRSRLSVTSDTLNRIYDTDDIEHAILYLGILAGGYPSVAPTQEVAERKSGFNFYLTTEDAQTERELTDKYGDKDQAYSLLTDLLLEAGNDAIVYISYLLADANKGYTRNTSRSQIKSDFFSYIEEGDRGKDKKKSIGNFIKLATEWKNAKEDLIGKSMISIGIHHGLIKRGKDKKYEYNGIPLGTTLNSAYDILMKSGNQSDFDILSTEVEKILNK